MSPNPASASQVILCLNSGSSSLKFALYRLGDGEEVRLAHGAAERIGLAGGHLWLRGTDNEALVDVDRDFPDHTAAAEGIAAAAKGLGFPPPEAVGHRVVHGGPEHTAPERVDAQLLAELRQLVPFAPLHLPSAIQGIEAVAARLPGLPQVACFDTAFHRRMPEVAQRFPLSRDLRHEGIRRYGFHGLSYEYIVATLGAAAQGRLVIAHLGNGASLAAVLGGLDTLVCTGGIGERAAPVRWEVCRGLAYLGIDLDQQKNAAHANVISTPGSACTVRVIPTNEDLMIARHTRTVLVSTAVP
jgi:acetate kinase